jgi:pyrroline-5-carboxylate reductase
MRWLFIGGGNMASSLVGGLLASGSQPDAIAVVDPDETTCRTISERFAVMAKPHTDALFEQASQWRDAQDDTLGVVLAVKPGIARTACESLAAAGFAGKPALLSVAAGVRGASLQSWLGTATSTQADRADRADWTVMRCMPNTPALLGKGASALYPGEATAAQRDAALALLSAVGTTVTVANEDDIDAVTALSGSGPAYVFRLAELMIENGVALGLGPAEAAQLGIATIEGAAAMLSAGEDDPATLRRKVTSPGGTTAAALEQFTASGLEACIERGMKAAQLRARELGEQMNDTPPSD